MTCSRVELRLASRSLPKPRLFSPNCVVIWDKKINDRNEIEMETLFISLMGVVPSFVNLLNGSSSIFCKHCRPEKMILKHPSAFPIYPLIPWVAGVITSKKVSAKE